MPLQDCHTSALKVRQACTWGTTDDLRHDPFWPAEHRGTRGLGDHANCGARHAERPAASGRTGRAGRSCDNLPGVLHADGGCRRAGVRSRIKKRRPEVAPFIQCKPRRYAAATRPSTAPTPAVTTWIRPSRLRRSREPLVMRLMPSVPTIMVTSYSRARIAG